MPIGPLWNIAFATFARSVCDTDIAACMCCWNARVGAPISRKPNPFTGAWVFNCTTRRRSVGSKRSCRRIVKWQLVRTMSGPWNFVHDQLATGKKLRVLTVVDTFFRYVPMLDPRHSYRGEDVVQNPERVCWKVGYPKTIRVDQGTEFVSRDLDLCAYTKGVTLNFSRLGKPTDNAYIEVFNGRFQAECLNQHWFLTLADVRDKMGD